MREWGNKNYTEKVFDFLINGNSNYIIKKYLEHARICISLTNCKMLQSSRDDKVCIIYSNQHENIERIIRFHLYFIYANNICATNIMYIVWDKNKSEGWKEWHTLTFVHWSFPIHWKKYTYITPFEYGMMFKFTFKFYGNNKLDFFF